MFHNDILLVDLEMSSDDPNTCDLVEIGAVLLDNRTLEIQDEYNSLIKPEMGEWTSKAEQVHGRKRDYLLKVGRDCKSVISEFEKVFDLNNVRLACWNIYDVEILRRLLKTGINNTHKIFELWSYTYPYLLLQGITPSKENVHGLNYFLSREQNLMMHYQMHVQKQKYSKE